MTCATSGCSFKRKSHVSLSFFLPFGWLDCGHSVRRKTPRSLGSWGLLWSRATTSTWAFTWERNKLLSCLSHCYMGLFVIVARPIASLIHFSLWTNHCGQETEPADWPDLGLGLYPWTERDGGVAPQGIWGCYHQKNVKWVLHRQTQHMSII